MSDSDVSICVYKFEKKDKMWNNNDLRFMFVELMP